MTEELKPCPFCGGKPHRHYERGSDGVGGYLSMKCGGCGAMSPQNLIYEPCHETELQIKAQWNTRALPAAHPAQAAQVPEERKLVPVEPTVEMALAGADVIRNRARGKFVRYVMHDVWAAMLAAAPQGAGHG